MIKLVSTLGIILAISLPLSSHANDNLDPGLRNQVEQAIERGLTFLRRSQAQDGSWSSSVGITALALRAFLESPQGFSEKQPFIKRSVDYLVSQTRKNGAISESVTNQNYNTAVAITGLQATANADYGAIIHAGQRYLTGLQLDAGEGYTPDHKYYGGIGYGGDERPDLSNAYLAIEALKATQLDRADPVWDKALIFISRSQNNSETNDLDWAQNDGGFAYMPGYSPHGGAVSYGSMTHAGLIGLLFAGTDKDDPRVQSAFSWIMQNYTLDANPGARHNHGLFYYYNAFAKSMKAYGEDIVTDSKGEQHNWRKDLAHKLVSLQDKDGSWINNDSPRYWEGNRDLVTAWSVIALNLISQ